METLHAMPADPQADWSSLLSRDVFGEVILVLRATLPPPISDTPAGWARQDRAAMAAVASLLPVNAAEGRLAAQFVAADAQAMDCLLLAKQRRREPDGYQCRAQAISFLRESKASLRQLLKLQAARQQANAAVTDQAAWTEHAAISMMRDALLAAAVEPATCNETESPATEFETTPRLVPATPVSAISVPTIPADTPAVIPAEAIVSARPAVSWPTRPGTPRPATPSAENSAVCLLKHRS